MNRVPSRIFYMSWSAMVGVFVITAVCFIASSSARASEKVELTDIAGRTVHVSKGVKRVVLGRGELMYAVGILDKDDPFQRLVGWKNDLTTNDPDAYRQLKSSFSSIQKVKNLGSPYSGDFSVESVIGLNADLVILTLDNLFKAREAGIMKQLSKAGIPVLFVDFRKRPTQNTVPSLQLLARAFDREKPAQSFIDFYLKQMRAVTNVVDTLSAEDRPLVFLENAPGWREPGFCCNTFGGANFGRFIDEAGGKNWGTTKFPGYASDVSFEAVLAADPDVVIGTGGNWAVTWPSVRSVLLGYDAKPEDVDQRLTALSARKGWMTMRAIKSKRFHSIYHQFYNSPYHFIALQVFAKWFHPREFAELDPRATFIELHQRFLPFKPTGIFWATLK